MENNKNPKKVNWPTVGKVIIAVLTVLTAGNGLTK